MKEFNERVRLIYMSFPHLTLAVDNRPPGDATDETESSCSDHRLHSHQPLVVERRRVINGKKRVTNRITTEREATVISKRSDLNHPSISGLRLMKYIINSTGNYGRKGIE